MSAENTSGSGPGNLPGSLEPGSEKFELELQEALTSATEAKQFFQRRQAELNAAFESGAETSVLLQARAAVVDAFVVALWGTQQWDTAQRFCVLAVGGYGRSELHPHSDVDILLLFSKAPNKQNKSCIEQFIAQLWDSGLEPGHSVRTVKECVSLAAEDITIMTNLLESRRLLGDAKLHEKLLAQTAPEKIWPAYEFFTAKWQEQRERHRHVISTEYNLEPNIKTSPGGLRDIQTISWVSRRSFGATSFQQLASRKQLTDIEAAAFVEGASFLWRVRYALHMVAGRKEDRLLFEYQLKVAEILGFSDDNVNLAVEQFMHEYYRRVMLLAEMNDVLMQYLNTALADESEEVEVIELNERFCVRNGYIGVIDETIFEKNLAALLEIFLLMAEHNYINGVEAQTIRLMRTHRERIDDKFRQDPQVKSLFMQILRSGRNVPLQLKRMRNHGILSKYLPAFGQIIGKMQYDLFHVYTVDIHTLEVVQNIYRFAHEGSEFDYLLAAKIINGHIKIELLYLAALFHDIAKGRGGDHSELGAHDAREFCLRHGVGKLETNLVVWLVENHLLMSSVSQKQDISDPDVIRHFAETVRERSYLDCLFVLTVADINGTNPELWNAWRASLLRQLYAATTRVLRRGLENPIDKQQVIAVKQATVLARLQGLGVDVDAVRKQWENRFDEYFLRESVDDLALHAQSIIARGDDDSPIILIRPSPEADDETITQITIYSKLIENRFSFMTLALEQLNLSIHDARLLVAGGGQVLDTFYVQDAALHPALQSDASVQALTGDEPGIKVDAEQRAEQIRERLMQVLESPDERWLSSEHRLSRRLRSFAWPSQTEFSNDYAPGFSVLEVIAPDRPGLLTVVGQVFFDHKLRLHSAKISTLGERVEDVFFLTDRNDQIIEDPARIEQIQNDLCAALDENTQLANQA
ncbi:MAG: [protein-PII] uridylyltransferase [Gammaproteobacteria bacterium]|nr:[protein-PII] uridylyltransferase [Gammaproteobacteria bacterium]